MVATSPAQGLSGVPQDVRLGCGNRNVYYHFVGPTVRSSLKLL